MIKKNIKRFFIGKPLKNEDIGEEKYGVFWGMPILASDPLSSVAYASEEILLVLIPAIGALAYGSMLYISMAIVGLVMVVALSYRQTIQSYPNGGGAYVVAKENLGTPAGVIAGAALSVDYILTVAVSISSAVAQMTSSITGLAPFTVPICVVLVLLLMLGNLRGIRESSRIFGLPAYAFILAILSMLIGGFLKVRSGYVPPEPLLPAAVEPITLFLILKAFSNGCAAVTGIEAVSNAVPNFKTPSVKHARAVMLLLSGFVILLFGGVSLMANTYHVIPVAGKTVLMQIAGEIFGTNPLFYFVMATSFIILVLAANTAFSGFPMLLSVMAKEGFVPRQLSMRGDRLSYSNGIILLSFVSILLIVAFNADVSRLIGLYAIGVFISFTLSQSGMFMKWLRERRKHWIPKALLNGSGAFVTAIVVVIIAIAKFTEGAWIVVFIVPLLIFLMLKVKNHYNAVARQLRLKQEELAQIDIKLDKYRNKVIVPIESVNKSSIRALRFASTISGNVVAFTVAIDEDSGKKMMERYAMLNTDIPLVVKYSPFRKVVEPLLKYIKSAEYDYQKGDMITVILPQFVVKQRWHRLLHNMTWKYIQKELLKHKHIVVATIPLQLKDDEFALKSPKYD